MTISLPPFEGMTPSAVKLTLTGTIADESLQPDRPMSLGQSVVLVVVGDVVDVAHGEDKEGAISRVHKVKASEAYLVSAEDVEMLLEEYRQTRSDTPEK
jgi:hypothetical protein